MGFWGSGILENDYALDVGIEFKSMVERGTTVEAAVSRLIDMHGMDSDHDDPYLALCNAVNILGLAWFALATTSALPERLTRLVRKVVETSAYVDQFDGEEGEKAFRQQDYVVAVMTGQQTHPGDGELPD